MANILTNIFKSKASLLFIGIIIFFFSSCKVFKKENCDCPHIKTTKVKHNYK